MRKTIVFIIVLTLAIFLGSACDSGLKIVKMEVIHYPYNIVYIAGQDSEIDLAGGRVKLITAEGQSVVVSMNNSKELEISSNIDYNKPGVYIVKVIRTEEIFCQFPVQLL
jgi:hypothetical protein